MLRRSSTRYIILLFISDLLVVLSSLYLAEVLRKTLPYGKPFELPWGGLYPPIYPIAAVVWVSIFALLSAYDPNRIVTIVDELQTVIAAVVLSSMAFGGTIFLTYRLLSRLLFAYFVVLDLCGTIALRVFWRLVFRSLDRDRVPHRRVLIVGVGDMGCEVARALTEHGWMGLSVAGFLDDEAGKESKECAGYPVLGPLSEVENVISEHQIVEVVIALPLHAHRSLANLVARLQDLNVNIKVVPDYMPLAYLRTTIEDFGGLPLVGLRDPVLNATQRVVKRIFDLVVASTGLVFATPLMLLIAAAIKLDSRGPVLFKQERVGERSEHFFMYKFRSMVPDASAMLGKMAEYDEEGHMFYKRPDDPRITRVGHFIRRTSLDELPQLVNVVKGEMSLVGPRPELPFVVQMYEPWQRKRFAVPPGITGWWQINGRSDKPMHLHTHDDLYYVTNYSLLLDLQILWQTVGAVIKGKGAY